MDSIKQSRARVKWMVEIQAGGRSMDGVTWHVSPSGIFIKCAKPLRLNEVCDLAIKVPGEERALEASAEVVWSNIHGQDDEVTPRGMGLRFLQISGEDRKTIARGMFEQLKSEKVDLSELRDLQTIMLGQDEVSAEAA